MPTLPSQVQHKSFAFQVKATGITTTEDGQELGQIEAYGSVFDNEDSGGDVVRPGAFKRTILNSKGRVAAGKAKFLAVMLWQHEPSTPIGGWYDLTEDKKGLLGKGQIVLGTQQGREAYELIKAGVVDQFSIGYDIPSGGANYDSKESVRNLTELRLWEISPVTFAMNQEAVLVGVKGADDSIAPPRENDGKRRHMDIQKKTFGEHYAEEMCADLLEDWQDVLICALSCAVLDAFKIGDQPEADIREALTAFDEAVMQWVAQGVEHKLSDYLEEHSDSYSSADYLIQYGSDSKPDYGYMSRNRPLSRKAGRAISAANASKIQDHVDSLHEIADKAMQSMKAHVKAVHSTADDLATVIQGAEPSYGTDPGTPDEGRQEGKGTSYPRTRATQTRPSPDDTVSEDELTASLQRIRALRTV